MNDEDALRDDITTPDHLGKRRRLRLLATKILRAALGRPPENREGKKPFCSVTGTPGVHDCSACVWE